MDPHPQTSTGYVTLDQEHFAWEQLMSIDGQFQDETGDMCEVYEDSFYEQIETTPAFDFFVQRQWSNKSAAAGHSPCVPAPSDPYFNVALVDPGDVPIDLSALGGTTKTSTLGVAATIGTTISFSVGFYSDAPMDPWTLLAVDGSEVATLFGSTVKTHFSNISIDNPKGQNGEKAQVTLTVNSTNGVKGEIITLVSSKLGNLCDKHTPQPGEVCHYMPILIGSE